MACRTFNIHRLPIHRLEAIKKAFSLFPIIEKAYLLGDVYYKYYDWSDAYEFVIYGHPDEEKFLNSMNTLIPNPEPTEFYEFNFSDEVELAALEVVEELGVLIYKRKEIMKALV